ncbi:MAG: hypothetical protein M1321_01185 [Candidatus Marsarchaeota archaeon]|nr:hypothetical protein [Candidatus Marsarchaeota archaeon]
MPITKKEKGRLRSHTFSEDKRDAFIGTHMVAPSISGSGALAGAAGLLASKPVVFLFNVPSSLIFSLYMIVLFWSASLANVSWYVFALWYTAAFFVLEIIIAAPLSAAAKAKLSGAGDWGLLRPMVMSLNYLAPLVPIAYAGILALAVRGFALHAILTAIAIVVLFVVAIVLHIVNINASLAVQVMYDKKTSRSVALDRSWTLLSGQSLKVLGVNIAAFLPLAVVVVLAVVFMGAAQMMWYAGIIIFVAAEFCISWWQASTSSIYAYVSKNARPMQYSAL